MTEAPVGRGFGTGDKQRKSDFRASDFGLRTRAVVVLCALALVAIPAVARAQSSAQTTTTVQDPVIQTGEPTSKPPSGRAPYRGLFGGGNPNPTRGQSLDLNFSTNGDYVDNLTPYSPLAGQSVAADPRFSDSYLFSGASAGLSYQRRWNRVSLSAGSNHDAFYYPDFGDFTGVSHSANVALSAASRERFSFTAAQAVGYSPFYGMGGMFGSDPLSSPFLSSPLYGVTQRNTLNVHTNVSANYRLTRRSALDASYSRQHVRFTEDRSTFANQTARAALSYRLTRNASLRAGYGRGWGDYGLFHTGGLPVTQHDIDAGLDYSRSLSRRRQSSFGFSTGATAYTTPYRNYYRFLASARIDAEVGRSWTLRADYRHGLNWLQGFPEPIYSDMANLGLDGFLGPRVQLQFSAGYSNGEPGLSGGTAGVDSYTGRAHIRVALSRYVGLSSQYFYYRYRFSADYPRPAGIPATLDRQSVMIGVDFWLPLLR